MWNEHVKSYILYKIIKKFEILKAASENPKIKACDRDESGVYTK